MKNKRIISLVMCIIMAISLLGTAIYYLTTPLYAAKAQTDPKQIDKYIVDFRTEASFNKKASAYIHKPKETEPDPLTGGKFDFDEEKGAMRILYSASEVQVPHRLMLKITALKSEYKYWVIVWGADTDKEYDIYLYNTPKQGQKLYAVKGAKDTNGGFMVSEPQDISVVENKKSLMDRWQNGANINTLNFETTDTDAVFYIREFGFFKSAEDAKAYYASVDLDKPASEYSNEVEKDIPAEEAKYLVTLGTTEVKEDTATGEPYVMKLTSKLEMAGQYADFYKHGDNLTEGLYEFAEVDGVKCLKVNYATLTETNKPYYRVMIKFPKNPYLTEDHKYMRVTYMTDTDQMTELVVVNNGDGSVIPVLAPDASVSDGKFVRTNVVSIESGGFVKRFLSGMHCTFGFRCSAKDQNFYISEIAFFTSPEQAYEYYGDTPDPDTVNYYRMGFGYGGNGTTLDGDTYGVHSFNNETKALELTYAEKTNVNNVGYLAKIKFKNNAEYNSNMPYMRVLYSAENPEGIEHASMYLWTDAHHYTFLLKEDIKDTNGKFVLSDVALLNEEATNRFAGTGSYSAPIHNSLFINCTKPGGKYSIKAVFFFGTRAEAEAFVYDDSPSKITVEGVDITKYKMVIGTDAEYHMKLAADTINARLYEIAGITLDIVYDTEPVSDYEIVIGKTNREGSDMSAYMNELPDEIYRCYAVDIKAGKIIITSELPTSLENAADDFIRMALYGTSLNPPKEIDIKQEKLVGSNVGVKPSTQFEEFENVDDPIVFTDDFDTDDGYWQEENNTSNWSFENGVYTVKATEGEYSYLHVYEPNAEFTAKVKFTGQSKDSDIALMLRQCSAEAWVKAGYDFNEGVWYIDSREGYDFYTLRLVSVKADVKPDTWYEVKLIADGEKVSLYVDGKLIGESDGATHDSPGKIAFYVENITAYFDDAKAVLLSGEGTIMKNTYHTYLMPDKFIAGGTVIEMNDGSLRYTYSNGINLVSYDKGLTWQECDKLFDHLGTQPSIIRLISGELIRMGKVGSNIVFFISEDDGVTWKQTGTVCPSPFRSDSTINAVAVNMNDKLTQSPTTGRIFYSQNYETTTHYFEENGDGVKRKVFCEFYYSDDKGYTWTKSETDSWEIEGNEKETHFGECKIIECADGTLRMYNSWNKYGCVIYSESTDNGVTWGPITKMPEIKCSLSSMQFVRDPYGETDHTYYMVNVYSVETATATMPRSRLSIMKTTDGKNWVYLGDLWRWESNYQATGTSSLINHIVNPFIYVTEDYIYAGCGTSERMAAESGHNYHQMQRQNIWTVDKSTLGEGVALNVFEDVKITDPAYGAISYVVNEGLFNGMSATHFEPGITMNRSMFVTVLGRLDKADVSAYTTPTFSDVKANQWYTGYVEWAAANGIVNGMGGGVYGVSGTITVEQACTILYRYATSKDNTVGTDVPDCPSLTDFTDASSVSDWAKDGVKWALENGIYAGEDGKLSPQSPSSRALVATMFANYVKAFG